MEEQQLVEAQHTTVQEGASEDDGYTIKEGDSVIFCINDEKYSFVEVKPDA